MSADTALTRREKAQTSLIVADIVRYKLTKQLGAPLSTWSRDPDTIPVLPPSNGGDTVHTNGGTHRTVSSTDSAISVAEPEEQTYADNNCWRLAAHSNISQLDAIISRAKDDLVNEDWQRFTIPVRRLVDTLEERYTEAMGTMNHDALILGDNVSQETYESVLREASLIEMNWGRVIAMLAFAGTLSCVGAHISTNQNTSNGSPSNLSPATGQCHAVSYVSWTIHYIETRLWPWIKSHGGWNGLIEFERSRKPEDILWYYATAAAKLAVGTMCMFSVMRYLSDRL